MKKICVIGDFIKDYYFFCEPRNNPEGNYPCFNTKETDFKIGGAGNVRINLESLGNEVDFFYSGERSIKIRIYSNNKYVFRFDDETPKYSKERVKQKEEELMDDIVENKNVYDYVVVSDYNKGAITRKVAREIMKMNAKIIVDCKPNHVKWFKGAYLWKPNLKEYKETNKKDIKFDNILITKGHNGMQLITKEKTVDIKPYKVKAIDATGAGDTVVATLTHFLNSGVNLLDAVKLSNKAGSIAVTKNGCYIITEKEILGKKYIFK